MWRKSIFTSIPLFFRRQLSWRKLNLSDRKSKVFYGCGIVAFVGNEPARDYLIEGLQILRCRGYDSAGISTIGSTHESNVSNETANGHANGKSEHGKTQSKIITSKFASLNTSDSFSILKQNTVGMHQEHCGIAHTRWATHGAKTDFNAHPHEDQKRNFSLVHNGTIENSNSLKKTLIERGVKFESETDSEVIVQLIGSYYDEKKRNFRQAVVKSMEMLQGTYGLAILCKDFPGQIIAVRNGSPLVLGIGSEKVWISSEYSAFARHTRKYVTLKDGEIAVIEKDKYSINIEGRIKNAPKENIEISPSPYPHWTLKEIMEQPESIDRCLNYGGRLSNDDLLVTLGGLNFNEKLLINIKHLVICACGSSLYAALYASKVMRELKSFKVVQIVNASEFNINYFNKNSALLVISQSGETRDVARAVQLAKKNNILVMSVVNKVGSMIAEMSKCGVYTNAGREFGVASTKSYVTQVISLILIAIWFSTRKHKSKSKMVFLKSEKVLENVQRQSVYTTVVYSERDKCKEIALKIYRKSNIFILGKGYAEAIAKEAALKIKELCYIHAEGFSGGELKHGPFALIESGTPIFIILIDDSHARLMKIACEEILARGGKLYIITDNERLVEGIECEHIVVRKNGSLSALLCLIPFQLIAYETALLKGINPDKPRNLAKSVTVD